MTRLTPAQRAMVEESGNEGFFGDSGVGVELCGAGQWATARSLVALGLGTIEGGRPQGSELPGLYFNNADGVSMVDDIEEEDGLRPECPECGRQDSHAHYM